MLELTLNKAGIILAFTEAALEQLPEDSSNKDELFLRKSILEIKKDCLEFLKSVQAADFPSAG